MRRRTPMNVWPAITDLMTSLAVVGLGLAVINQSALNEFEALKPRLDELDELDELLDELDLVRAQLKERTAERDGLEQEVKRLNAMQRAVELAGSAMSEVAQGLGQQASEDLSVSFAEDLVAFGTNQVQPRLHGGGRDTLNQVCRALSEVLGRHDPELGGPLSRVAQVVVEGHTDAVPCPGERDCNWRISAERAVNFRRLMTDTSACPGSGEWTILPQGLGDSQPRATAEESRRIQVRIIPDYAAILAAMSTPPPPGTIP